MAITFSQTDLDNLLEAYKTGARRVKIGDKEIEYNSPSDILKAIQNIQRYLDGTQTSEEQPSLIKASFSKGDS